MKALLKRRATAAALTYLDPPRESDVPCDVHLLLHDMLLYGFNRTPLYTVRAGPGAACDA